MKATKKQKRTQLSIEVGELLFEFSSLDHWSATARSRFAYAGSSSSDSVCIDCKGRICRLRLDFMRAEKDKAYPIRVYRI
jgi:hypothetical protein